MHCIIADKTIALVNKMWKCQGERVTTATSKKEKDISFCYSSPFTSMGIFFNSTYFSERNMKRAVRNILRAHCKICLFHMTPCPFLP